MKQLDLFEEPKHLRLEREIEHLKGQYEKIRKGQFAKISEIKKMYTELYWDFENLKRAMCSKAELF